MKRTIITSILASISLVLMATYTPYTVPNPRVTNGYVSNPDQIISPSSEESLNQMLSDLEEQSEVQMAVVPPGVRSPRHSQ